MNPPFTLHTLGACTQWEGHSRDSREEGLAAAVVNQQQLSHSRSWPQHTYFKMSMLRYTALSDSSSNECILIIEQYSQDSLFQASAQTSHDSFITLLLQCYV